MQEYILRSHLHACGHFYYRYGVEGAETMKLMEEKIQDVLIEILKEFGIPENFYSLGGYAEETVCLEKKGDTWIVYGGERGQKHNVITHINCKSACLDLLSRLAETRVEEERMKIFFEIKCKKIEE